MFRSVNEINMDAKGRIAMPVKFRDRLMESCAGHMMATIHIQNKCLLIYPAPVWADIEKELQSLPTLNPAVDRMRRLIIGYTDEIDLDSAGRILLKPALRQYAQLEKKVVLVGQGNKLELWNADNWSAECQACFDQVNDHGVPEEFLSVPL